MRKLCLIAAACILALFLPVTGCASSSESGSSVEENAANGPARDESPPQTAYTVADTGQTLCYDASTEIACPLEGQPFYGQDAQYDSVQPAYRDNGDGTITDLNTGLTWQKSPDLGKSTYAEALAGADSLDLAGYDDWRLPTIKELYSLIDFAGSSFVQPQTPYINTIYFDFSVGDEAQGAGGRSIDGRYWSSTEYVGTVLQGQAAVFGVNFADGRIKGYPRDNGPGGQPMVMFVRYVRGNDAYGKNAFVDNGDGTITDSATGLMWMKSDSGSSMNWEEALAYSEGLEYAGYDDWRLPNAKELQSILDYSRAPDAADPSRRGAAIDPVFTLTETESWFWTSTTLLESPADQGEGSQAVYIAFGRAFGLPNGVLTDVHGAGAQRSDPKSGNPADYATGRGTPGQDDQVRIYNYVRCVRNAT